MLKQEERTVELVAVRAEQWETPIYVGVADAKRLIEATTVHYYDPQLDPTDDNQGYQRPPERSRITKIGSYLLNPEGEKGVIFPTAVLLASRSPLRFNKTSGTVSIPLDSKLQIVDGQHRLAGIQYAIEEKEAKEYEKYPIPFVILETDSKLEEMTQFRIVNGTAKSVRTDLVNMILTATYSGTDRIDIPGKDKWRIVVSNVVDRMAKDEDSVWFNNINLPGEEKAARGEQKKIIRATSFITSLKPVYDWLETTILEHTTKTVEEEIDGLYAVVNAYWLALKEVVPEAFEKPEEFVIQKTPGLFSLHKLLKHLMHNMHYGRREFSKENFVEFLEESPEITNPTFWEVEARRASVYGSMKGFQELYEILSLPYRN